MGGGGGVPDWRCPRHRTPGQRAGHPAAALVPRDSPPSRRDVVCSCPNQGRLVPRNKPRREGGGLTRAKGSRPCDGGVGGVTTCGARFGGYSNSLSLLPNQAQKKGGGQVPVSSRRVNETDLNFEGQKKKKKLRVCNRTKGKGYVYAYISLKRSILPLAYV